LKEQIVELLRRALATLPAGSLPEPLPPIDIERTREVAHGDFASNIALKLARSARRNPRELAQSILAALPASPFIARAEVAGAGFINFHLAPGAYTIELQRILDQGAAYGHSAAGAGQRVLVEFVSANPTGPLHVGHGRHAAFGASLANLLSAVGYAVTREFYINDAGRQVDILAASAWLRYLELCGETFAFPSNGYRGDYLRPIAEELLKTEQRRLHRPAAQVFSDLPADAPAGDKD
jgi:arginyl-tRNA synthetase